MLEHQFGCYDKSVLKVKLFGGIESTGNDVFRIGDRNLETVRNELRKLKVRFDDRETGGSVSRTLIATVETGEIGVVKRPLLGAVNLMDGYVNHAVSYMNM